MVLLLLFACTSPSPTPAVPGRADSGSGLGTGAGSGGAPSELGHDYTRMVGEESFEWAEWVENAGDRDCHLRWSLSGTPTEACDGCALAFDVALVFDGASSLDDGSCGEVPTDRNLVLAYTEDFEGNGGTLMRRVEDQWFWWSFASLDGSQLTWSFGWEDWQETEYDDLQPDRYLTHFTSLWAGSATVE